MRERFRRAYTQRVAGGFIIQAERMASEGRFEQSVATLRDAQKILKKQGYTHVDARLEWKIGQIATKWGNGELAYEATLAAAMKYDACNKVLERAICLDQIGGLLEKKGDYAEALEYYEEALKQFDYQVSDFYSVRCRTRIGHVYYQLEDFRKADGYLRQAREGLISPAKMNQDQIEWLATCTYILGALCVNIGNAGRGREYLEEARLNYIAIKSEEMVARCSYALGVALAQLGDRTGAREMYILAKTSAVDLGLPGLVAHIELSQGLVEDQLGNLDQATALIVQSIEYFNRAGEARYTAKAFAALGSILRDIGRREEARDLSAKAAQVCQDSGNRLGSLVHLYNCAKLDFDAGKIESAHEILVEAISRARELSALDSLADCTCLLGLILAAKGDYQAGHRTILEARELYKSVNNRGGVADSEYSLAKLAYAEKKYREAFIYSNSARQGWCELHANFDVALSSYFMALMAWHGSPHPLAGPLWSEGLLIENLIAAVQYTNHIRFQFRSFNARQIWSNAFKQRETLAFKIADSIGDEVLLSDLIEFHINSGIHSASSKIMHHGPSADLIGIELRTEGGVRNVDEVDIRDSRILGGELSGSLGGGSRLISMAILPLVAPPSLVMPDGHVALTGYVDRGNYKFPSSSQGLIFISPQ